MGKIFSILSISKVFVRIWEDLLIFHHLLCIVSGNTIVTQNIQHIIVIGSVLNVSKNIFSIIGLAIAISSSERVENVAHHWSG